MSTNWLTRLIGSSPKKEIVNNGPGFDNVPEGLWIACPTCGHMHYHRALKEEQYVCSDCGHHFALMPRLRCEGLFDGGDFEALEMPEVSEDPLKFKDTQRYADRLKKYRTKTSRRDAVFGAFGKIGNRPAVVLVMDFNFMGGSMGRAVGEALVKMAQEAVSRRAAFLVVTASGGARMQEGLMSLMQMPRSIVALDMVRHKKLPYIVLLTNPTMGGVSASFAMLGDINMAEPGAIIGFAGRRVIEQTIHQTLPDTFQTAEFLEEHGMVDMVVHRRELNKKIGTLLSLLMKEENASSRSPSSYGD